MRWKTILILALSAVLFLFLSYRVGDRLLEKHRPPPFTVLDSLLRHSTASGDWRFDAHTRPPAYRSRKTGWWTRFGIRRHSHFQQDHYRFIKSSILTSEYVVVTVWREDGKVVKLHFTGSSLPAEDFKKVIFRKFPPLGHPRFKP